MSGILLCKHYLTDKASTAMNFEFYNACATGDVTKAKQMLQDGVDVNGRERGDTVLSLMNAAIPWCDISCDKEKKKEIIQLLEDSGATT